MGSLETSEQQSNAGLARKRRTPRLLAVAAAVTSSAKLEARREHVAPCADARLTIPCETVPHRSVVRTASRCCCGRDCPVPATQVVASARPNLRIDQGGVINATCALPAIHAKHCSVGT